MAFIDVSKHTLSELVSLEGRVAVVTGAAKGIGQAIALRLAEAGATVMLADKDATVARVVETIRVRNQRAESLVVDTRNSAEVNKLAQQTSERFDSLDIWVNDAGIYPMKPAIDITDADWAEVIDTNLTGMFYGARAAAKQMIASRKAGVIVNIASSLGYHGVKNQASYVASKFAVRGLTAALAMEWAGHGIRVLAVGPGFTDTPGMKAAAQDLGAIAPKGDAFAAYAATNPSRRLGTPDDIARTVLFAVSDLAIFYTGSTILADGGEVAAGGAA